MYPSNLMIGIVRRFGLRLFLGLLLFLAGAGLPGIAKPAKEIRRLASSDEFFASPQVSELKIEITGTNLTALQQRNREYVRATVREGETVYKDVAIHLKGAAGSFRGLDDPQGPALTLNFDKFHEHQRFHGLDKIHLNNSVQDPSYMTEIICGDLFRAAGVPAARGTHARVWLNGHNPRLYVLKEGFGKEFLRQYFSNANGNLYDCGFLREITDPLQRISGEDGKDVKDFSDLKAVAAAANESDPVKRMERLDQALDLDRFISFTAMEIMTYHWDGYAMKRNNYRVFHDLSTGRMVFFPHGMDQMFWDANYPILPNPGDIQGVVAQKLIESPAGKKTYLERVGTLFTNLFKVEVLTNQVNELQQRIRPVLASIDPNLAKNHDGAVDNLRRQIIARCRMLERQLNPPAPLKFDSTGIARITNWRMANPKRIAQVDKISETGKTLLHINTLSDTNCVASWRCRVLLSAGDYHFTGMVRTSEVIPVKDKKGEGAGIRISQFAGARTNAVAGTAAWIKLQFDFQVPPGPNIEKELLCELRASKGEAWFDPESLMLLRKPATAVAKP